MGWNFSESICLLAISAASALAQEVLPPPTESFHGRIGLTALESTPEWPRPVRAPEGAPNVVLLLLDDVGFGAASVFGGPARTPGLERLAAQGLRYNRFHVTALCSPTRAALLSGRNDHRAGFGTIADDASGFPGYNAIWRRDTVTIAELLRRHGYSTAAFGKWHNTPTWERTPAGPFDRWPTGLGFEYFYGFLAGNDSQWEPTLYRNTTPVPPPATPEQGYYLNTDLAGDAIKWLHTHQALAPDKPYFLYFAPGSTHSPQQAPRASIDAYRGRFDQGWDRLRQETFDRQRALGVIPANAELTPRPAELPAWNSLSPDEQKICARQMEVYAAFLESTDHEVDRLVRAAQQGPGGSNTLVIYIVGDNGADAKGGRTGREDQYSPPESTPFRLEHLDQMGGPQRLGLYASGWAWALCTPFQWEKRVASHLGGTRDPLVVSWPAVIRDPGGLRSQYTHANDIAPTLLELAGIRFPTVVDGVYQIPFDGVSFADSFTNAAAPSRHRLQIYEQVGNRAIYRDGWLAAARHTIPWLPSPDDYSGDRWELYNLETDYSQAHDLAATDPAKLIELQRLFDREARKNDIYPLAAGPQEKFPDDLSARREFVLWPDIDPLPSKAVPAFRGSHRISADLVVPDAGAEGIVITDGGRSGGFVLYLQNHHAVYENNISGFRKNTLRSTLTVPPGRVRLEFEFLQAPGGDKRAGGTARLRINGQPAGEAVFETFGQPVFGTLELGQARTARVSPNFELPFRFTGTLEQVRVEVR